LIIIEDDIFPVNEKWNEEFCKKFKNEIAVPFLIKSYPGYLKDSTVRALKEAGCAIIRVGIEAFNENIRKKVLNRHMTNIDIEECFQMIHKYGIKAEGFVLSGIPYTYLKDDLDTFEYVRKLNVSSPIAFTYQPYPKTPLFNMSVRDGLIKQDYKVVPVDLFPSRLSPFIFTEKKRNRMVHNLTCLYPLLVNSKINTRVVKFIISLPLNWVYFLALKLFCLKKASYDARKRLNFRMALFAFYKFIFVTY